VVGHRACAPGDMDHRHAAKRLKSYAAFRYSWRF